MDSVDPAETFANGDETVGTGSVHGNATDRCHNLTIFALNIDSNNYRISILLRFGNSAF